MECTGKNKTPQEWNPYFDSLGVKKVIVACPVKGIVGSEQALNIVYGINHSLYKADKHKLITAASCTTNCLAPIVKVVNENFSIKHGANTWKVWRKKTSPTKTTVQFWGLILTVIPLFIALALNGDKSLGPVIVIGLIIFGFIFAMNSSTHSYLILAYSDNEKVSLNVGYYYMANAAGRLLGTLLSGLLFMLGRNATLGLQYCLYASTALIFIAWLTSSKLPSYSSNSIDWFF